ncbi:MAG: hypothetical protein ACI89S_001529 [Gammaproteobacteria bacterium]|jgi:hypothetical protein
MKVIAKFSGHVISAVWLMALLSNPLYAGKPSIPDPPDSTVILVADNLNYNGLPLRTRRFDSSQSMSKVLSFYKRKWAREMDGRPGFLQEQSPPWQVLSRIEEGYLLTVQVQPKGKFKSWGYLGVSNMADYLFDKAPEEVEFPAMRGSKVTTNLLSKDPGLEAQTVVVQNNYSVDSNIAYYKNHYSGLGWVVAKELSFDQGKNQILRLVKNDEEINLVISDIDRNTSVVANKVKIN